MYIVAARKGPYLTHCQIRAASNLKKCDRYEVVLRVREACPFGRSSRNPRLSISVPSKLPLILKRDPMTAMPVHWSPLAVTASASPPAKGP